MNNNWITILTVTDEIEANLKKSVLENFEIDCLIEPVQFTAYGNLSEFKLNVQEKDAKRAKEILDGIDKR